MNSALFSCSPPHSPLELPDAFQWGHDLGSHLPAHGWSYPVCISCCSSTWALVSAPSGEGLFTTCQPGAERPTASSTLQSYLAICSSNWDFLSFKMKMFWEIISKSLLNWRWVAPTVLYPNPYFIMEHNQVKHTLFALGKSKCWVVPTTFLAFRGLEIDLEVCLELSSNTCEISKSIVFFLPFLRVSVTDLFPADRDFFNHHPFPQIKNSSLMDALCFDTGIAF